MGWDEEEWNYNQENVVNYGDADTCRCGGKMSPIYDDYPNGPTYCPSCG